MSHVVKTVTVAGHRCRSCCSVGGVSSTASCHFDSSACTCSCGSCSCIACKSRSRWASTSCRSSSRCWTESSWVAELALVGSGSKFLLTFFLYTDISVKIRAPGTRGGRRGATGCGRPSRLRPLGPSCWWMNYGSSSRSWWVRGYSATGSRSSKWQD